MGNIKLSRGMIDQIYMNSGECTLEDEVSPCVYGAVCSDGFLLLLDE